MPMNQSIDSTRTSPIAGIAGTAFNVAARMTIAEPGHPVSSLGGHKGNGEDQEKIGERERRIGRLGDEHGRERKID